MTQSLATRRLAAGRSAMRRSAIGRLGIRRGRQILATAAATALVAFASVTAPAHATNQGTRSGVETSGCKVSWTTSATNNTGLTTADPTYPGLMTDVSGQPVDYSNGGYISEVAPSLGGPGLLEMQHWYTGATAYFRIPMATKYALNASSMQVTLPSGYSWSAGISGYDYVTNPDSSVYPNFQAAIVTPSVTILGNVATVNYPAMPANSHALSVQFSASIGSDSTAVNRVASATLTGWYAPTGGNPGCTVPPPPTKPRATTCQVSLAGQTVLPLDAPRRDGSHQMGQRR